MKDNARYWVGADPGGKKGKKFGLAFLDMCGKLRCTRVSSVDEAVARIFSKVDVLLGLGIDAPMWWSSAGGGGRKSDSLLRSKYRIHSGTVQSVNSLKGAALVGGMLLASRVREKWNDANITESHPKALLQACGYGRRSFPGEFGINSGWSDNEDEQDAAIAAVCAREGFSKIWKTDLVKFRNDSEQDPENYWLGPMHYFWPHDLKE